MSELTKRAMGAAFKKLLLEKPLNKITVQDITDECGVNRQTFYYHFDDIPDFISWICLNDADQALKDNKTYETWQEGFLSIFNLMLKDKQFIMNIHHSISIDVLESYLYRLVYPLLINVVNEKAAGLSVREEDKEFIADFYKFGFVGLVLKWINDDMKENPSDIISKLSVLIKGTIDQALDNYKTDK